MYKNKQYSALERNVNIFSVSHGTQKLVIVV